MILRKVNCITDNLILENRNLIIENGVIKEITKGEGTPSFSNDTFLTSGYIDIHTHGAVGYDFCFADDKGLNAIDSYLFTSGTHYYCPTLATMSLSDTMNALSRISSFYDGKPSFLGAHLEGPFLSPSMAGAHKVGLLQGYSKEFVDLIEEYKSIISRITMSFAVTGSDKLYEAFNSFKIHVSIGHESGLETDFLQYMTSGANCTTHLFNRCSQTGKVGLRKRIGLTEATLLLDSQYAEVIADGIHVANGQLALLCKNKSEHRIILVSDSLALLGMESGSLSFEGYELEVRDGAAVIKGTDTLAGSITPVSREVENMVKWGYPIEKAVTMVTATPASLLGRKDIDGIAVGKRASFNLISDKGKLIQALSFKD